MHWSVTPPHRSLTKIAVIDADRQIDYAAFDALIDRIAASLQASGLKPRDAISICALSSIEYAAVFLGALRVGVAVAPLAPSSTPTDFAAMVKDAAAKILFMDDATAASFADAAIDPSIQRIALDGGKAGKPFAQWLAPEGVKPTPVAIDPEWVFNIIYSSGTTGTPKGIIHTYWMRWRQYGQLDPLGYGPDAVTVLSTPLYSNTTLVCFNPTLAGGGTAGADEEVRCAGLLELSAEASGDPCDAGAGAVSPHYGRAGFRQFRSQVLRDEVLDLGAIRRRAEGRCAETLAGRADRILRDDRGRRHLRAAGA